MYIGILNRYYSYTLVKEHDNSITIINDDYFNKLRDLDKDIWIHPSFRLIGEYSNKELYNILDEYGILTHNTGVRHYTHLVNLNYPTEVIIDLITKLLGHPDIIELTNIINDSKMVMRCDIIDNILK